MEDKQQNKNKAKRSMFMAAVLLTLSVSGVAKLMDTITLGFTEYPVLDIIISGIGLLGLISGVIMLIRAIKHKKKA